MLISRLQLAEKLTPPPSIMPSALFDLGQETRDWFENDQKWKVDVNFVLKLGDAITNITNSESFETSSSSAQYQDNKRELEQIEDQIPTQRVREFTPIIKTENYTAVDCDFVDMRNNHKVTLTPSTGAQIITANGDGSNIEIYSTLKIHMNGKVANSVFLNRKDTVIHWYLFESDTEQFWRGA